MGIKILTLIDIIIMVMIILFPYQFDGFVSIKMTDFNNYLLLSFLYIIIKSMLGIIIISNKVKNKVEILFPRKYLFIFLLPVIFTIVKIFQYIIFDKYSKYYFLSNYLNLNIILIIVFLSIIMFVSFLFIELNSTLGIIIIFNKIKSRIKKVFSIRKLLILLPSIILTTLYLFLYIFMIYAELFLYLKYDFIFISILIFYGIIIFIGFLMWLINWTFYESNIKRICIIMLNLITYISLVKLILEIYVSFLQ
jgi:hypothetical protein